MRQRFLFSLLIYVSPWFLVVEAFAFQQISYGTTSRRISASFSAGSTRRVSPFVSPSKRRSSGACTRLFDTQPGKDNDEQVEVGTKEYYSGFLSSPIQDETVAERGSGLEQALKLGGGVVLVLIVLVIGFMASNGLL